MKSILCLAILVSSGVTGLQSAIAACNAQSVTVSSGKVELAHYEAAPSEIHRLTVHNGFNLGLKIEPALPDANFSTCKLGLAETCRKTLVLLEFSVLIFSNACAKSCRMHIN